MNVKLIFFDDPKENTPAQERLRRRVRRLEQKIRSHGPRSQYAKQLRTLLASAAR